MAVQDRFGKTQRLKKTYKIIDTKYRVEKDGKNCLYLKADNSAEFKYAELVYLNDKTRVRVMEPGINLWAVPNKLKRRLRQFLDRGFTVYITGQYRFMKIDNFDRLTS